VSVIALLNKLGIHIFCLKCGKKDFDVNWREKSMCCLGTTAVTAVRMSPRTNVGRAAAPSLYFIALNYFSLVPII
jgi:ribosomal protein L37E